jgi:hypothetical protein
MELRAADADVKQYLNARIQSESRLVRLLAGDADLHATVIESIVNNAKGMFLLAQLQMDSVSKKNNRRDIRRSLLTLPQKLHEIYSDAMRRIQSQSQEDIDLAQRLLTWIVCAKRPLTLMEVLDALAVEEGDTDLVEEGIPDEDLMIAACAGLVTIDIKSKVVRLVHYTAQEYFENIFTLQFPRAQALITSTCLTYLSFEGLSAEYFSNNAFRDILARYPLARYAVQFWGEHARGDPEITLEDQILEFLENNSKASSWYRMSRYVDQGYDIPTSQVWGLHMAAGLGLSRILNAMIFSSPVDINVRDSAGLTPLHWAANAGHDAIMKTLLQHPDILPDAPSARGLTPFILAASKGHSSIVSLLLYRKDININIQTPSYGTSALHIAVDRSLVAVLQLLLSNPDIDVNIQTRARGQTALWRAADRGDTQIVRLLLQRPDIDLSITDSAYRQTPLQRAIQAGHSTVVELLTRAQVASIENGNDQQ